MNYKSKILQKSYLKKKADDNINELASEDKASNLSAPIAPRQKIPYEVWIKSKKSDGTTYEQWARRVNRFVSRKYGLSMEDFPDWLSGDAYEGNKTVEQGFRAFQRAQKDSFGDLM